MANLASLTHTGKLNRKKGTGTRPAGATTGTNLHTDPGGTIDWSTGYLYYTMSMCYHRALNKVFAAYMQIPGEDGYGIVGTPSADGTSITWGSPQIIYVDIHGGTACSYDRKEEKILWAAQSYSLNGRYSAARVVSISGTTPSYGNLLQFGQNEGSFDDQNMGDKAMVYLGDDAGTSAGYHLLLKEQHITDANDKLYAYIAQITAGTTNVTMASTTGTQIDAQGAIYDPSICKIADNKAVGIWTNGSTHGRCGVFVVTPGSPATVAFTSGPNPAWDPANASNQGPGACSICYDAAAGKVLIAYLEWDVNGGHHKLKARTGTVSGTNITLHTVKEVLGYGSGACHDKVTVCYDENVQRSIIFYKRQRSGTTKLYAKATTIANDGTITLTAEKIVETPAAGQNFHIGANAEYSYACTSTYVSHADVKKTLVLRAGGASNVFGYPTDQGGLPHATFCHFNKTSLTVDLSQGNSFVLDIDTHTGVDGAISTFNITEALGSGKTQTFFLKIIQGSVPINFDWSEISNIKWPGGTGPSLTETNNAVDVLSFITWDEGTTWYGKTEGLNIS